MFKIAFSFLVILLEIKCCLVFNEINDEQQSEYMKETPKSQNINKNTKNNKDDFWSSLTYLDYEELVVPLESYIAILQQDILKPFQENDQKLDNKFQDKQNMEEIMCNNDQNSSNTIFKEKNT